MENSDSQPKMCGTKKKSLSKQIDFFTDYKHYQKSESEDPVAFPKSWGEHWCHKQRVIKGLFIVFTELYVHVPVSMTSRK